MKCNVCKLNKDISFFYKDKSRSSGYCSNCKNCDNFLLKRRRMARKVKIIKAYGGCCICCRETDIRFLTIDHKNNDGSRHRKEINRSSGDNFYKWMVKNNYPEYLQVLCYNCNMAKYIYGQCPHRLKNGEFDSVGQGNFVNAPVLWS